MTRGDGGGNPPVLFLRGSGCDDIQHLGEGVYAGFDGHETMVASMGAEQVHFVRIGFAQPARLVSYDKSQRDRSQA